MTPEAFAEEATKALGSGDAEQALEWMQRAVTASEHPRPDLEHGIAVILLQLGRPGEALPHLQQALELAWQANVPGAFLAHIHTALAAAHEDLDQPTQALEVYDRLYDIDARHEARASHAHLLLGMGRTDEGLEELGRYLELANAEEAFKEAATKFIKDVRDFREEGDPREFLAAHRGGYVEFFDAKANEMAQQGWIAEPARMTRAPDGRLLPVIPEGARPYAAVRVDLASPEGGAGQIGDQPMVVALAGFETLAQAPVSFFDRKQPFPIWVASQCPWDQLPITVVVGTGSAVELVEPIVAEWYTAGFNGAFGAADSGRFHYISDPEPTHDGRGVRFHVDLGRAELRCVDALIDALVPVHSVHGVDKLLFGRGHA